MILGLRCRRLLPDCVGCAAQRVEPQPMLPVMPDDHSELVPLLPIPNRTVKRLCADDSAATSVKVGHRQATYPQTAPPLSRAGALCFVPAAAAPASPHLPPHLCIAPLHYPPLKKLHDEVDALIGRIGIGYTSTFR